MPFHTGMKQVYTDAIKPACEKANFKPLRADELIGPYNIHRDIIKYIFSSDVIIADLTGWNPNVFYEMGVAHTLDNKTMMIIQEGEKLPFDIGNYRCIYYEPTEGGLKVLMQKIVDYLQTADSWCEYPTNPVQEFKPHEAFVPKADWEVLQKKFAAKEGKVLALEKELEHLSAQLAQQKTKISAPILLRSQPLQDLSGESVKAMLKKNGFYCANVSWSLEWSHPDSEGIGIVHQFEQRKDVVLDFATSLTWQRSGATSCTYTDAENYVLDLNNKFFAGYNNWRLPTLEEMMSLMEMEKKNGELYIDPIFDKDQRSFWTADKESPGRAWVVEFSYGYYRCVPDDISHYCVRAVR